MRSPTNKHDKEIAKIIETYNKIYNKNKKILAIGENDSLDPMTQLVKKAMIMKKVKNERSVYNKMLIVKKRISILNSPKHIKSTIKYCKGKVNRRYENSVERVNEKFYRVYTPIVSDDWDLTICKNLLKPYIEMSKMSREDINSYTKKSIKNDRFERRAPNRFEDSDSSFYILHQIGIVHDDILYRSTRAMSQLLDLGNIAWGNAITSIFMKIADLSLNLLKKKKRSKDEDDDDDIDKVDNRREMYELLDYPLGQLLKVELLNTRKEDERSKVLKELKSTKDRFDEVIKLLEESVGFTKVLEDILYELDNVREELEGIESEKEILNIYKMRKKDIFTILDNVEKAALMYGKVIAIVTNTLYRISKEVLIVRRNKPRYNYIDDYDNPFVK